MGSSCGTAVEHRPWDSEELGSNPVRCWAIYIFSFFLCTSLSFYQWCVLNQVPHRGTSLLIFLEKCMLSCAAWGKASLIRTDWAKEVLGRYLSLQGYSVLACCVGGPGSILANGKSRIQMLISWQRTVGNGARHDILHDLASPRSCNTCHAIYGQNHSMSAWKGERSLQG